MPFVRPRKKITDPASQLICPSAATDNHGKQLGSSRIERGHIELTTDFTDGTDMNTKAAAFRFFIRVIRGQPDKALQQITIR
ncbi:MAG: hypothetical protein JWM11_6168 [Planctomycetaceae bacterium]|nr:hypothetical protein [Planctomycetaceae bacterium]